MSTFRAVGEIAVGIVPQLAVPAVGLLAVISESTVAIGIWAVGLIGTVVYQALRERTVRHERSSEVKRLRSALEASDRRADHAEAEVRRIMRWIVKSGRSSPSHDHESEETDADGGN